MSHKCGYFERFVFCSPASGIVVPALAVHDAVKRLEEFDFHGYYAVTGRRATTVHADSLKLHLVVEPIVMVPVAALPDEPAGCGHRRLVHHNHAVGLVL